jgi:hypothetical protein
MHWNQWVRQFHRWVSLAFMATVIACVLGIAVGEPPMWLFYVPLLPLFVLLVTGLYLFVLPYAAALRNGQRAVHEP